MTCTKIPVAGGVAFVCTRGASTRARDCAFCGTSTRDYKLCDFPLRGKRAGATCSKPMCGKCATSIGENRDLCPPHVRMAREHKLDLALLAEAEGDAGKQVALDQLEQNGAPVQPRDRNKAVSPIKWRQRKAAAIDAGRLGPTSPGVIVTAVADWYEFLEERAAIGEYLGGLSRGAAEQQARELAGPRPK